MNYRPPGLQAYLTSPDFFKVWANEDLEFLQEGVPYFQATWDKAFTLGMRIRAILSNVIYGIVGNGPYWIGSIAFSILMNAFVGGGYAFHCVMYLAATVISYVLARVLPLKTFSSDGAGDMRPLVAGLRNGIRMLLPFVLAHISSGRVGLYPLVATFVTMIVEGGKHAVLHSKEGYMFSAWTFLTDLLERRLAVSGINLPTNFLMLRFFLHQEPLRYREQVGLVYHEEQKDPLVINVGRGPGDSDFSWFPDPASTAGDTTTPGGGGTS